jgi:hypothetical protein
MARVPLVKLISVERKRIRLFDPSALEALLR